MRTYPPYLSTEVCLLHVPLNTDGILGASVGHPYQWGSREVIYMFFLVELVLSCATYPSYGRVDATSKLSLASAVLCRQLPICKVLRPWPVGHQPFLPPALQLQPARARPAQQGCVWCLLRPSLQPLLLYIHYSTGVPSHVGSISTASLALACIDGTVSAVICFIYTATYYSASMDSNSEKEETEWNPHMMESLQHVETRSPSPKSDPVDERRSVSGSVSTSSTSDGRDGGNSRGRRSKPSVTASASQLATVQEMKEQKGFRALSTDSTLSNSSQKDRPSIAKITSDEGVVSSKKVRRLIISYHALLTEVRS